MRYEVRRSALATQDIRDFARYLKRSAGTAVARTYLSALEHDLDVVIATRPRASGWLRETGQPYRAKLFRVGRSTWWIIYVVDDKHKCIDIVRLWSTVREPGTHSM
jgi:plasmid stabilization system protein ParE